MVIATKHLEIVFILQFLALMDAQMEYVIVHQTYVNLVEYQKHVQTYVMLQEIKKLAVIATKHLEIVFILQQIVLMDAQMEYVIVHQTYVSPMEYQ
jgi:hypothetical protein